MKFFRLPQFVLRFFAYTLARKLSVALAIDPALTSARQVSNVSADIADSVVHHYYPYYIIRANRHE